MFSLLLFLWVGESLVTQAVPTGSVFLSCAAPACKDRCLVSQAWIAFTVQVLISPRSGHDEGHDQAQPSSRLPAAAELPGTRGSPQAFAHV